jgi:hypothetical protein
MQDFDLISQKGQLFQKTYLVSVMVKIYWSVGKGLSVKSQWTIDVKEKRWEYHELQSTTTCWITGASFARSVIVVYQA